MQRLPTKRFYRTKRPVPVPIQKMDFTKIMLWNSRGWRTRKEELFKRCQEFDINIVTEIKAKSNEGFKVPGLSHYY